MNSTNLSIERLDQPKFVNLSLLLPTIWDSKLFNAQLIGCLSDISEFLDFSTVSIELTTSNGKITTFSRYFAKEYNSFAVKSYYPNAERIVLPRLTPYHAWELIDDIKDLHIQQKGAVIDDGFSIHLYPQVYSARIFEEVSGKNSSFEFYIGDKLYYFSLVIKNKETWFTPSNKLETRHLPFGISIWYTQNKIELDIRIHWNVFAIKGTRSNLALLDTLNRFMQKGWVFDSCSDIKSVKNQNTKGQLLSHSIEGFFELEPMEEKVI